MLKPTKTRRSVMSVKAKHFWLSLHLISTGFYVAGVGGSVLLLFLSRRLTGSAELGVTHGFIVAFDEIFIIPSALACLVTGIWLSWRTNWGVAKYYWIIVKLISNIALILFGSLFIHFRIQQTLQQANSLTKHFTQVEWASYLQTRTTLHLSHGLSLIIILAIVVISVYKPWGKTRK